MPRINQEKGFLLMTAMLVIIFLSILSAAIFNQSIAENTFVKKSVAKLKARYYAEFGITCATQELINGGYSWYTHTTIPDDPANPTSYSLATSIIHHDTSVLGASIPDAGINAGNYIFNDSSGTPIFTARIYQDPIAGSQNQFIILSRGQSGSETCLLAAKIAATSLYQYFYFTPYGAVFAYATWNAYGGKMHANGNIIFGNNVFFQQIGELSTAGYFSYNLYPEIPPDNKCIRDGQTLSSGCNWDKYFIYQRSPYRAPNPTPSNDNYYNKLDGYVNGEPAGLYMQNPLWGQSGQKMYVPCTDNTLCILPIADQSYIDRFGGSGGVNSDLYQYDDYLLNGVGTKLSDAHVRVCLTPPCDTYAASIRIPNRFNDPVNSFYSWNKYQYTTNDIWWDWDGDGDRELQKSGSEERFINAMNTDLQRSDWQTWLSNNSSLQPILKDASNGGTAVNPIKINAQTYFNDAQTNGIYIFNDTKGTPDISDDELKMTINNATPLVADGNGDFKTTSGVVVAKKDYFINPESTLRKDIIRLDIGQMKNEGLAPSNGIIYANYDVALENASTIFDNGLTTVTSQNCYLVGDYNYNPSVSNNWKPSAVIAAKFVYTLSGEAPLPKDLQDTNHNINWPYTVGPNGDVNIYNDAMWAAKNLPHKVTGNHEYDVSIVGYKADSIKALERWNYDKQRTIVGAKVVLKSDNFLWPEADPTNPTRTDTWPYFDYAYPRFCDDNGVNGFVTRYPSASEEEGTCRNQYKFPGWSGGMAVDPELADANNIYKFETRYNINNASTLPPGALPGYAFNLTIELSDTDYNFSHHPMQLN